MWPFLRAVIFDFRDAKKNVKNYKAKTVPTIRPLLMGDFVLSCMYLRTSNVDAEAVDLQVS